MPLILNKETGEYEVITKPEDLPGPGLCWASVVSCGSDKKKLDKLYRNARIKKNRILKEMKRQGMTTIKEYNTVKEELAL